MRDTCAEISDQHVSLRLLPGSRGELEINTAIVRRFSCIAEGELQELTALTPFGAWVAHARTEEDHVRLLREGDRLRDATGLYMLVNKIDDRLGARYEPGKWHRAPKGTGRAGNNDIVELRSIFLDYDPKRPSGISATDSEQYEAWEVSAAVESWLRERLGPEPIGHGASGNGFYTLIALEPCAPTDETNARISRFLELLNKKFGTANVKVDKSVANPGRLMAAPGTWKRKGTNTVERPHRLTSFSCRPNVVRVPLGEIA